MQTGERETERGRIGREHRVSRPAAGRGGLRRTLDTAAPVTPAQWRRLRARQQQQRRQRRQRRRQPRGRRWPLRTRVASDHQAADRPPSSRPTPKRPTVGARGAATETRPAASPRWVSRTEAHPVSTAARALPRSARRAHNGWLAIGGSGRGVARVAEPPIGCQLNSACVGATTYCAWARR